MLAGQGTGAGPNAKCAAGNINYQRKAQAHPRYTLSPWLFTMQQAGKPQRTNATE